MTDSLFSLEEWTAKVSASAKSNTRTVLAHFQRHWFEGHLQNPLLFPMDQTHQAWKAHLDWFLTVEKFQLPDQKPATPAKTGKSHGDLTAPPPSEAAETVFFNVENIDRGGKTVIYDPPKPPVVETDDWGELDDLGTLIVENQVKGTGTVIGDDPSPAAGKTGGTGQSTRNKAPETDRTIMMDQAPELDVERHYADQTVLIDRAYSEDREVLQSETVIYQPESEADQTTIISESTMMSESASRTPGPEQGTMVMEPDTLETSKSTGGLKVPSGKTAPTIGARPVPKEVKAENAEVEKEGEETPAEVDLDLEDLDTMVWLDDEETPDR